MLPANDLDGIDFKPFFDMVVGIIFVLLILIGALIFFQQAQQDEGAATAAQKGVREWQAQELDFLRWLAGHLRDRGLAAEVDLANAAVVMPLADLVKLSPEGLPNVLDGPTSDLGRTLAQDLGCVAAPIRTGGDCSRFNLLHLNEAVAQVRSGSPAAGATLAPDRFAHLLASVLGATLLKGSPDLLKLSSRSGTIVVRTTSALLAAATSAAAPPGTISGDLAMSFDFAAP